MADHAVPSGPADSHLVSLLRETIPPMHPGGRPIVFSAAAATLATRYLLRRVGLRRTARALTRAGGLATVASALFFREPHRVTPRESGVVVAPADGRIAAIDSVPPPPELGLDSVPRTRISIFLSLLDVHVQRIPIDGVVTVREYRPGKFLSADLDKASQDNERNSLVISPTAQVGQVVVTQIAGLLARRIVCDVTAGSPVLAGATYGLIRFGSRVDTYLPVGATPTVRVGQRAVGGETIFADLAAPAAAASRPPVPLIAPTVGPAGDRGD
jgi:phosphatidylserine decarboxylase